MIFYKEQKSDDDEHYNGIAFMGRRANYFYICFKLEKTEEKTLYHNHSFKFA